MPKTPNYHVFYLAGHTDAAESFDIGDFKTKKLAKRVLDGESMHPVAHESIDKAAEVESAGGDSLDGYHDLETWKEETDLELEEDGIDIEKAHAEWRRGWLDEAKMLLTEEILNDINALYAEDDEEEGDDGEEDDDDGDEEDDDEEDED